MTNAYNISMSKSKNSLSNNFIPPHLFKQEKQKTQDVLHFNFVGAKIEDINVNVIGRTIVVSGPSFSLTKKKLPAQTFELALSPNDNLEKISAVFNNGYLSVVIPHI